MPPRIHTQRRKIGLLAIALAAACTWFGPVPGVELSWAMPPTAPADLTQLSLEQLMDLEVTSVAKKAQKLSGAAAAVFVITQEDLRRSGAASIPEALRMVPGVEVARIDSSKWAISIRGFNARFSNKLLVLIDGRTVYNPLFAGVFWDTQDTLLEDVDRIEVIRGPGASLWGANAVNGVINIITKKAQQTQGILVTGGGGTVERGFGGVRYGGQAGPDAYYRVYAKYLDRPDGEYASGAGASDGWEFLRTGFRLDWDAGARDKFTALGEIYDGDMGELITEPLLVSPYSQDTFNITKATGGHLLSRWERTFSPRSSMALLAFYDRTKRVNRTLKFSVDMYEVDFQHRFAVGEAHDLIWGLKYRLTRDQTNGGSFTTDFSDQKDRTTNLISAFVQDDISLLPDKLILTVGSKLENNRYTGFEYQPTARLLWRLDEKTSAWSAVSRAVRTPSRGENDARINSLVTPPFSASNPGPLPVVTAITRNRELRSEELLAYEVGLRSQLTERFSFDAAAFYNQYDNLATLYEPTGITFFEASPPPPHIVSPFREQNRMKGETYGVELAAEFRVTPWWCLKGAYSFIQIQLHRVSDGVDTISENAEKRSPHNQASLRSLMDIGKNLQLDLWLRYADNVPDLNVPKYVTLDLRVGWTPVKNLEIAIVGQNLLDRSRPEFTSELLDTKPTEVQRGVYAKATWRF